MGTEPMKILVTSLQNNISTYSLAYKVFILWYITEYQYYLSAVYFAAILLAFNVNTVSCDADTGKFKNNENGEKIANV